MIPPIGPTRADMIAAENARLRAEVERLRAALAAIRNEAEEAEDAGAFLVWAAERAREALGEEADHG